MEINLTARDREIIAALRAENAALRAEVGRWSKRALDAEISVTAAREAAERLVADREARIPRDVDQRALLTLALPLARAAVRWTDSQSLAEAESALRRLAVLGMALTPEQRAAILGEQGETP